MRSMSWRGLARHYGWRSILFVNSCPSLLAATVVVFASARTPAFPANQCCSALREVYFDRARQWLQKLARKLQSRIDSDHERGHGLQAKESIHCMEWGTRKSLAQGRTSSVGAPGLSVSAAVADTRGTRRKVDRSRRVAAATAAVVRWIAWCVAWAAAHRPASFACWRWRRAWTWMQHAGAALLQIAREWCRGRWRGGRGRCWEN